MASVFKRGGKDNRGGYWYVSWFDHTGRRRSKCDKTTDKATAERIGQKLETEAAKRREGLIDPQLEAYCREARRPLADLLAEYRDKLQAGGRTAKHVKYAIEFVNSIAEFAGYRTIGEIAPEGVNQYARHLLDSGRAARTIQAHLSAAKGFTRWLVQSGKLPATRSPASRSRILVRIGGDVGGCCCVKNGRSLKPRPSLVPSAMGCLGRSERSSTDWRSRRG